MAKWCIVMLQIYTNIHIYTVPLLGSWVVTKLHIFEVANIQAKVLVSVSPGNTMTNHIRKYLIVKRSTKYPIV